VRLCCYVVWYLDTSPPASSSRELLGLQASLSAPSRSDNMLCDFSNQTNLRWASGKSDENPSKFGSFRLLKKNIKKIMINDILPFTT